MRHSSPSRTENMSLSDPLIVKVGGGSTINLPAIARDLRSIETPVVVVHGANACRDELAGRLGTPPVTITSASGIESVYTDDAQLELLTMAYAGLANKRFVQLCQQEGVNAIGLSGLDGAVVRGRRNPAIRVVDKGRKKLVRDHSGKPVAVNTSLLRCLLEEGTTPLLTVPILDESGRAVNTENDTVVALLQEALGARTVVQLIEARGFLDRPDDDDSVIPRMSFDELDRRLASSSGRFRRKLMALTSMRASGCETIHVGDGRGDSPLTSALAGIGTTIE